MKQRIRVNEVRPGMFSNEKYVEFEIDGRKYSLFVDEGSLKGKELEVQVVGASGEFVLVELPRDTMAAGSRVRVPRKFLLPA